jgi:hypothetical protein
MTFEQHFSAALTRQATRQNRELSPINLAVAKIISSTASQALKDTRANLPIKTFKVVSAPTGSSKTNSATAFANAMFSYDPSFTCAFIVEEIRHAQEIHEELSLEIPAKELGIWTGFHDVKLHNPADIAKYGFTPTLTTLEAVSAKRIVVYTHRKWLSEIESGRDFGVRSHGGKPRDVVFIDEQPAVIQVMEKTPADILALRDMVVAVDENNGLIEILGGVVDRMEAVYRSNGSEQEAINLIEFLDAYSNFNESDAYTFCTEHRISSSLLLLDGFRFLKACSLGYCFLTRQSPRGFVAYLPTFSPEPNQVILDATADISGLYSLLGGMLAENIPTVDYCNLNINHIQAPIDFKSINTVMNTRSLAVRYEAWVRQVVMDNTKVGDKVLVVIHKAMTDNHELLPHIPKDPSKDIFLGRETNIITWGQGIGSNQYKDCTEVFMFSEFYKPRRSVVANTLGARHQRAEDSDISSMYGRLKGDFLSVKEGDILRWTKQLASRGNVRNIDGNGACGIMNLYTTMDFDRLISNQQRLFPNAKTPKRTLQYVLGESKRDKPKRRKGLIDLLSTTALSLISFRYIQDTIGIKSCDVRRELDTPIVKPVVIAYGWKIVSSKDLSKAGKGSWLVKE